MLKRKIKKVINFVECVVIPAGIVVGFMALYVAKIYPFLMAAYK